MLQLHTISWSIRRVWLSWLRLHKARSVSSHTSHRPILDDEEMERQAKNFLENMNEDQKKQLKIIEMEYELLREKNEPVPNVLTYRQKKKMILHMDSRQDQLEYISNLIRTQELKADRKLSKLSSYHGFENYPLERQGTFVFAETRHFHKTFINHRLMRASMPIIHDVGYPMNGEENWKFLKYLLLAWKFAKEHTDPARIIITGLRNNPVLKTSIMSRPEVLNSLMEFHDEPYWKMFPGSQMIYIDQHGSELTDVNEDKAYVLFGGNRWPKIMKDVEVKSMPYQKRLLSKSKAPVIHLMTKLLMDLNIEKDVDKVYVRNFKEGVFQWQLSIEKHKDIFLKEKEKAP